MRERLSSLPPTLEFKISQYPILDMGLRIT